MVDGINREAFQAGINSGELTERVVGNFRGSLENLDRILFTDKEGLYRSGWRGADVAVGVYKPPSFQNVPNLMRYLGETLGTLESKINWGDKTEVERLAAWAISMIIRIHPKLDGNGRLSKASAEILAPHKILSGYANPTWVEASHSMEKEMVASVAHVSSQRIPPALLGRQNVDPQALTEIMYDFYFHSGADWPAYILNWEMNQVGVDTKGRLTGSVLSAQSTRLMTEFVRHAPERASYPQPDTGWFSKVRNLFRSRK